MRNDSNLQQIAKEQCRYKLKYCAACEIQAMGHYQEVKLFPASLNFCVSLPSTSHTGLILGKVDLYVINRNIIHST